MTRIFNHLSLVLLLCFCQQYIRAQTQANKTIDSLLIVLKTAKEDTSKANSLNALSEELFKTGDISDCRKYADSAFVLSEKMDFKKGIAHAYNNIGLTYNLQGNYAEALENHLAAMKIFEEIGNKHGIANSYRKIGIVYDQQGNYPKALENYMASLEKSKEIGDKHLIGNAFGSIGNVHGSQGNYPEALKNYLASLKVFEETGNKLAASICFNNIGTIYGDLGNYDESLKNYFISLRMSVEVGYKSGVALSYFNIGGTYTKQNNFPEALKNYSASLKIYEELGGKVDIADIHNRIGEIFEKQGNYAEALKKATTSLRVYEEAGNNEGIAIANIDIGTIFLKQAAIKNDPASRLEYNKAIQHINKGLKIAKEIGYPYIILDGYESLTEAYSVLNDYKKALEYNKLHAALIDSLMNNETTRKLEQQRTQYEVEKAVTEEKVKQDELFAKQKAERKGKEELMIVGFGIFVLVSVFAVLLVRQRNQKRRAVEKAEAGHKMAELELQSLRAQLNPHFMFNSLNAIQDLIVNERNEQSHLYLSRFSKLLRMLLDNANQPFVTVKQELELLELYLSLENLRIPNLQYSIEKDPKLNADERMIPNMMLQPYIENAIWHGLSNKKGERRLQIRIHENGNATEFEVEDNGVGRKRAAELKQQFRHGHHSKGMQLLSKRFELFSKEYGTAIQTTITDLVNNGDASGTLVKIDVPFTLSEQARQLAHDEKHHN